MKSIQAVEGRPPSPIPAPSSQPLRSHQHDNSEKCILLWHWDHIMDVLDLCDRILAKNCFFSDSKKDSHWFTSLFLFLFVESFFFYLLLAFRGCSLVVRLSLEKSSSQCSSSFTFVECWNYWVVNNSMDLN